MISDDKEIAEKFNDFFVNIVSSVKISPKENYETDAGNDNEPILKYINQFKNHPSIKIIKSTKKKKSKLLLSTIASSNGEFCDGEHYLSV